MEVKLNEVILYIVLWAALVAGYLIVSRIDAATNAVHSHTTR